MATSSTTHTHPLLENWQAAIAGYIGYLRAAGRPSTTITLYRHYANWMAERLDATSPEYGRIRPERAPA